MEDQLLNKPMHAGLLNKYIENNKSLSQFQETIHTKKLTTILALWRSNVSGKMETLGVFYKKPSLQKHLQPDSEAMLWKVDEAKCFCEGRLGSKYFPQWQRYQGVCRSPKGRLPGFEYIGLIFPTSTCYDV